MLMLFPVVPEQCLDVFVTPSGNAPVACWGEATVVVKVKRVAGVDEVRRRG